MIINDDSNLKRSSNLYCPNSYETEMDPDIDLLTGEGPGMDSIRKASLLNDKIKNLQ